MNYNRGRIINDKSSYDMPFVNFDNAATTFPKPIAVKNACVKALEKYGGNPGRSGHTLSIETAEQVYKVRSLAADFFKAKPENVIFALNCTHALNMAIKGVMMRGGHVIFSSLEHNAVARPCYGMMRYGCTYSIARVEENDDETVSNFEDLITPETKCIVTTIASNITGQILPYKKIAALCKRYGICYIVDGAQACGVLPITMEDGFNILCTAGHKGLYGPTGTGLLISDGTIELDTIVEGGTGATSDELVQTPFLPERLESGTVNTVGIMGLGEGISFIKSQGVMNAYYKEEMLCRLFISKICNIEGVTIYRKPNAYYAPIVSFNIAGSSSQEVAEYLNSKGFGLRGGLHCASVAHRFNGTIATGTVRFAPSLFNSEKDVLRLCEAIKKYYKYSK